MIAYLINQYPTVSHAFIRREIESLEKCGEKVLRVSIRGWDVPLADQRDLAERAQTWFVLRGGVHLLAWAAFTSLMRDPRAWLATLVLAFRLSHKAEKSIARHVFYFFEACAVSERLKANGVRHIHAHFGTNSATVALLCSVLSGIPFSFTVHGFEEFDKPGAIGLRQKILYARFVVGVSSFGRSQLMRLVPLSNWSKIHVVHCCPDRSYLLNEPSAVPITRRFVSVGRLCAEKGQLLLVEAIAILRDRSIHCELVLAGDGEYRSEIEASIDRLGISDRVCITGWLSSDQVRDYILNSRALVLPSFIEGLPVVVMEAMSLARPVITTYVAGVPELVVPGDCGWLVPAGDIEALCEALEACLSSDPDTLNRMGLSGRSRVLSRHDPDCEVQKLVSLFGRDK